MAEWIGRRIKRAHAFKFCGLGADVPLHKRVQTVEDLDADNVDGDPGPWECEKNSLLLGPTTAQRNVSMQAQRALWDHADRAVCAAQVREMQCLAATEGGTPEQQAGPSDGGKADSAAAAGDGSAGPSHGMQLIFHSTSVLFLSRTAPKNPAQRRHSASFPRRLLQAYTFET